METAPFYLCQLRVLRVSVVDESRNAKPQRQEDTKVAQRKAEAARSFYQTILCLTASKPLMQQVR